MELYPGREDLDRPADRERLLLRLRVPRRHRARPTPTSSASRSACASTSAPTSPSCARTCPWPRRSSASAPRARTTRSSSSRTWSATRACETVSLYTNGPFTDLCRGPHAPSTKRIGVVKLQSLAGAYWRGDADRQMLTRVYGTAFFKERAGRAPRAPRAGPRARPPPARPAARALRLLRRRAGRRVLAAARHARSSTSSSALSREMCAHHGYDEVKTPQLYDAELWKTSGHWCKYRENMFVTEAEDREIGAQADELPRPLPPLRRCSSGPTATCPSRYAEPGPAAPQRARRARCTACCACATSSRTTPTSSARPEQVAGRGQGAAWTWRSRPTTSSASSRTLELSTRPDERIGDDALWDEAEALLAQALEEQGLAYEVNEGDGAFYGPKIDLHFTRLARPLVAARHGAARLPDARALRPHLHGRRQRRAPRGDDPPRAVRLLRALHRDPARAHRAASCRSGWRRCRRSSCRSPTATPTAGRGVARALREAGAARRGRRAHGVGRAQDPRRRAAQGALHARRRRPRGARRARSPCAATARATRARSRWPRSSRGWPPRSPTALSAVARRLARAPRRGCPRRSCRGGLRVHERARPAGTAPRPGRAGRSATPARALRIGALPRRAHLRHALRAGPRRGWRGDGAVVRVDRERAARGASRWCRRARPPWSRRRAANPPGSCAAGSGLYCAPLIDSLATHAAPS